ncbi:unnamed protein product [Diamesa tonsa]
MNKGLILERLNKLKRTYIAELEVLILDVQNNKFKIGFQVQKLYDMKRMLQGEVRMNEKLLDGLEEILKRFLECRVVYEISDDDEDSDVEIVEEQEIYQPNLDDIPPTKRVKQVVRDNPSKVPKSKNIKRIGEYSSMIQKEQFLEHTEEGQNPISEPSELENEEPTNTNKPTPAYVLKLTKLRPASSYAKPSNTEARNIVTVPYKPTVKLPCKVLKPVKKLNMITNAKVPQKPFDPRDDAIAIKHIKEKIYQKSYLRTNENEETASKPTEAVAGSSSAKAVEIEEPLEIEEPIEVEEPLEVEEPSEIEEPVEVVEPVEIEEPVEVVEPPKKKLRARRNTIAERPAKVTKVKSPKKAVEPKRKMITRRNSVAVRPEIHKILDRVEEIIADVIERSKTPVPTKSTGELYTQGWLASKMKAAKKSSPKIPNDELSKEQYDALDPEGLMESITTFPVTQKRTRGRPRSKSVYIPQYNTRSTPIFDPTLTIKQEII